MDVPSAALSTPTYCHGTITFTYATSSKSLRTAFVPLVLQIHCFDKSGIFPCHAACDVPVSAEPHSQDVRREVARVRPLEVVDSVRINWVSQP